MREKVIILIVLFVCMMCPADVRAENNNSVAAKTIAAPQTEDKLPWWPTEAQPAPVMDKERGGFWWWPSDPGTAKGLWGNRGYAYVNKVIYDWRGSGVVRNIQVNIYNVGFAETEDKPSLLIKRMVRDQKYHFKGNDVDLKPEQAANLKKAAESLKRNKEANALIASFNDAPELGSTRARLLEQALLEQGVLQDKIKIISSEKFQESGLGSKQPQDAGTVQLIVAEIQEVMIPGPKNK